MAREAHPPKVLEVGDTIAGRYRLDAELGAGGFGAVYCATQLDIGREVALKVLHGELLLSQVGVGRFLREAKLAQRLEHPNTVRLFDFGQTDDGQPYIAFQLLRGRPLDLVIHQDGPMPAARVARVASQVLKSLMEAHELGIIHRDIKPQNIFLTDFQGEPDFVKVLDFGVAKPLQGDADGGSPLTLQGEVIGTPNYMAPEQVNGDPLGPPTDLYSLGLVMAEMLTGQQVITGTRLIDVCWAQASDKPVPLPEEVLGSPLGPIIAVATQKPSSDRYQSGAEMLSGLEAAVSGPSTLGPGRKAAPTVNSQPHSPTTYPQSLGEGPRLPPTTALPSPTPPPTRPATEGGPSGQRPDAKGVSLWLFAAIGGGILFFLLAALSGVVFAFLSSRRAPESEPSTQVPTQVVRPIDEQGVELDANRPPPESPAAPPMRYGTKVVSLTPELVRARVEAAGWEVANDARVGPNSGLRAVIYSVFERSQHYGGGVSLYEFDNTTHAERMADALRAGNRRIFLEGNKILVIEITNRDSGGPETAAIEQLRQAVLLE